MYRTLLLAWVAALTSGCLLSLAAGVPLGAEATQPGATKPPADQPTGPNPELLRSLVGGWRFNSDSTALVFDFKADGAVTSRTTDGTVVNGRFALIGDALTITFPNLSPISGRLSFSADKRTLTLGNATMTRV